MQTPPQISVLKFKYVLWGLIEDQMEYAIKDVNGGMSIRKVVETCGLPRVTIGDRMVSRIIYNL